MELDLSAEGDIQEAIEQAEKEFEISLSEEEKQQIVDLLEKIGSLDLDVDALVNQAKDLYDRITEIGKSSGFFDKVADFFQSIIDYIKGLFG